MTNKDDKVGKYWNKKSNAKVIKNRFWHFPIILNHINKLVCGIEVNGHSNGLNTLLKKQLGQRQLKNGISIGCGVGAKEISLVKLGVVDEMMLFELSEERVKTAQQNIEKNGLDHKMKVYLGDVFKAINDSQTFEFIHWNGSLHHMFDTHKTIEWCYNKLSKNGVFYANEYTGKNRFQWSKKEMEIANEIRNSLHDRYFKIPNTSSYYKREINCPNLEKLIEADPSESVDSENILSGIEKNFNNVIIKKTGGLIYQIALLDVLVNFTPSDNQLLKSLLAFDKSLISQGYSNYSACLAFKN